MDLWVIMDLGKTMLFKCIAGLVYPTHGEILFNNEKLQNGSFPEDLDIIIETPGFIPTLTGVENLLILAQIKNVIKKDTILKYISLVGLDPNDKKKVKDYSLGMRQRLGIAQAIMESPSLLILDEPFNSLDKNAVATMKNLLKELNNNGTTILLTSHIQGDINDLCNVIYEVDNASVSVIS